MSKDKPKRKPIVRWVLVNCDGYVRAILTSKADAAMFRRVEDRPREWRIVKLVEEA